HADHPRRERISVADRRAGAEGAGPRAALPARGGARRPPRLARSARRVRAGRAAQRGRVRGARVCADARSESVCGCHRVGDRASCRHDRTIGRQGETRHRQATLVFSRVLGSRRNMNAMHTESRLSRVAFLVAAAAAAQIASAQLEEVVVTAQKREQSMQDVGISVSAFSAQQLENLGIKNTTSITEQIPGLQLSAWSPAFTIFSLRGVSQTNFQDNLEAPVAVYVDGAYVASMNAINAQLFDMDRVEVLRGPQGTLFGRNATGGLIHFLTHRATDKELNGYVEAGGAEFSTYSFEGALGGSFSDRLRGRIAGRWEQSDGYVKPGSALGRTATGRDSFGANGYALRGSLQFDATDDVTVDVIAAYSRDHDVPTGEYIV